MTEILRAGDGAVYLVQDGKAVHVADAPPKEDPKRLVAQFEAARWRKFRGVGF